MKKNKLTFLVAASFLALSTLIGCNNADEPTNGSSQGTNSVLPSSDVGGNSNAQSSDNGGNTSQGGGQETKTDWTDAEKATMRSVLHGLVLPFVEMDVSISTNSRNDELYMISADNMQENFLANYAAKFTAANGWQGGDISDELGQYANSGLAYGFVKEVTQNGSRYYVSAMFAGVVDPQASRTTYSKTGKFILQTGEPYVAEYPASFIAQWLQAQYNTTINPPAFQAEYYCLADEGIMYGYTETNPETTYKNALTSSNNFTVDADKDAQGYYVAHPKDGTYTLRFQYVAADKIFVIMVTAPQGWNNAAINAIFVKNNVTPFSLGSIDNPNITFNAMEQQYGTDTCLIVSVGGVSVQDVQSYVNSLKALGYKVANSNVVIESNQYSTVVNVITNEGMFTVYLTYSTAENANSLMVYLSLTPNPYVVKDWPAASVARYLLAEHDSVPAFAGNAYGYNFSVMNTYNNVVVILDNGAESAAKDSYIATLTSAENGYTAHGTLGGQPAFLSPNSEILVAVGCDPTSFPGEIDILIQNYTVVATPWPSADIATAISNLFTMSSDPITDTVPALDVSDASSCYVNDNYGGIGTQLEKFEIVIDGLAASMNDFIGDFKTAGWTENPYYEFDSSCGEYGALISPNHQLVAYFDTYSNDLSIYVKSYYEESYYTWPAQELSQIITKWGVKSDTLPSFDYARLIDYVEGGSEQKVTIEAYVGNGLQQTVITDYCIALESIGYHYDETLGGHISDNHELLIKFDSDANGVKIIVSCVKIVYKVVGLNNQWDFADGTLLVDAPDPDYKEQYSASFHVDAGADFKVLDSENNWFGASIAQTNSSSVDLSGDNIHINDAGTVTLYFKIFDDDSKSMWIGFQADPVAVSWPTDAINGALEGWNVDDEIPELTDSSISDVQYLMLDSGKVFTLTVVGGAGLEDQYNSLLGASFTYDPVQYNYVSSSGKLIVSTHSDAGNLIIVVGLLEQPELVEWPADAISGYLDAWNVYDTVPEVQDEVITDITVEPDGESHFIITLVDGGSLYSYYEGILGSSFDYDNVQDLWVSAAGQIGIRLSVNSENLVIDVEKLDDPAQNPVYKLVGSFSDWNYNDDGSDELFEYDPEEGYLAQYSIYFEVKAGDEFKIYDGSGDSGWVGGEALYVNQYSEWFEVLEGGNIRAKQDGEVDLSFDILSDGTKVITINDFIPQFEDGSWAKASYEASQDCPDAYIPNLEIEGASEYVYNGGNGSIDISFSEGADLTNVGAALDAKLTAAGFHYSARFDAYVKVSANTIIGVGFNDDMTISLYPGEYDFTGDSGYGLVIFSYDTDDDYYYDDGEEIGKVNPENSNEYMLTYSFEEGTWFIIYDYSDETEFKVTVDDASGVGDSHNFYDYFEYDMSNNMFRVKQSFEGTIYIKLSYGNDQIYVAITNPNP